MTAFLLFDELEREFEPLEEHPARHAAALAMYCLIGQKCAQRMTDGDIARGLIVKTFAAWPAPMVALAIADLVALAQWEETAEGALRFVGWDVHQFTREQELNRRERQVARQRKRRKDESIRKSGDVTRDVPSDVRRDVAGDVTVPSASASPSPSPKEGRRAGARPLLPESGAPENVNTNAEPARPRPTLASAKPEPLRFRQPLEDTVRAAFFARGVTPQKASPRQWADGCQTVQDALDLGAHEDAAAAIARFAQLLVDACAAGKKLSFALQEVSLAGKLEPVAPQRALSQLAKATIAASRGEQ